MACMVGDGVVSRSDADAERLSLFVGEEVEGERESVGDEEEGSWLFVREQVEQGPSSVMDADVELGEDVVAVLEVDGEWGIG